MSENLPEFIVFADGGVDKNRRRSEGGANFGAACVAILKDEDPVKDFFVAAKFFDAKRHNAVVTNSTMELHAIGFAVGFLADEIDAGRIVNIWTDSQYAIGCLKFATSWNPQKNVELIRNLRKVTARPNVRMRHVHGHQGMRWNELVDTGASKSLEVKQGFKGRRETLLSRLCLYCKKFPCEEQDAGWGKETSLMKVAYSPVPCEGKFWEPYDAGIIEAYSERWERPTGSPGPSGVDPGDSRSPQGGAPNPADHEQGA